MADIPFKPSANSRKAIVQYINCMLPNKNQATDFRSRLEEIDRQYMREPTAEEIAEATRNDKIDKKKLKDFRIPVILPHIETQVGQLVEMFLTGYPVIAAGASPENQPAADKINALNKDHQERFGWVRQLTMWLRDGVKYNWQAAEVDWVEEKAFVISSSAADPNTAQLVSTATQGNRITRIDPYNSFWDQSCPLADVHKRGAYAGYTELLSRVALNQKLSALNSKMVMNADKAYGTVPAQPAYFIPQINRFADLYQNGKFNWDNFPESPVAHGFYKKDKKPQIKYSETYELTTAYCRIIPTEFGLQVPGADTLQVWKFLVVNQQYLVYAEQQTNAHNYLPIIIGQPEEHGLGMQTKSDVENLYPIQELATQLHKARLSSLRRSIADRGLYDPSRVDPKNINADAPAAKIPVRPNAYGKPLSDAYMPIPFRDETGGLLLQEIGIVQKFGEDITAQNPAQRGQFVKGNKTLQEYQDVMSNGSARSRMRAMAIEAQSMAPIKEVIKLNILQYQPPRQIVNPETGEALQINPAELRTMSFFFKMADGLMPVSKVMSTELMTVAFQTLQTSQMLQQDSKLWELFAYMFSVAGFPEIAKFKATQDYKLGKIQEQQQLLAAAQGQVNGQPTPTA